MKSHKNRKMSPTVRHKYKYFYSTVQRAKCRRQKFHFCRLPFDLRPRNVKLNLSNIWSSPHQNTLQGNRHSFFITHHLTPPVVRIPSLTVSFSRFTTHLQWGEWFWKQEQGDGKLFPKPWLSIKCGSASARTRISYPSWRHYFGAFRCDLCSTYHPSGVDVPSHERSGQKHHD